MTVLSIKQEIFIIVTQIKNVMHIHMKLQQTKTREQISSSNSTKYTLHIMLKALKNIDLFHSNYKLRGTLNTEDVLKYFRYNW